jgi:hypothetical protein
MRTCRYWAAGLILAALAAGCGGPARYQTKVRLVKNGEPFRPAEGELVRVMFVPVPEGGGRAEDFYVAEPEGTDGVYRAAGKDRKGLPPGKYRVSVELLRRKKDVLNGAFDAEQSPVVRDVPGAGDEITVDLAKPKG